MAVECLLELGRPESDEDGPAADRRWVGARLVAGALHNIELIRKATVTLK